MARRGLTGRTEPWRSHLDLRTRITIGFALGALVLSAALAGVTYASTRASVLSEHESAAAQAAIANAIVIEESPTSFNGTPSQIQIQVIDLLTTLDPSTAGTLSLLHINGQWFTDSDNTFTEKDVSSATEKKGTDLLSETTKGAAAYQILQVDGAPQIVVGVPIPAYSDAWYFEAFPITPVLQTLHKLLASLLIAALVATIGAAVLGRSAARRVLRPLREISEATLAISGGQLTTRIVEHHASDLRQIASSFNKMVDQLEQRNQQLARFASDVAHELRSPLTTLASSLSVIEARRTSLPERSRQALDLLSVEMRRFQRMVADLLEISRSDAGSAEFDPNPVGVAEIIHQSLAMSHLSDVPLVISPEVESRRLIVDKRRFERIIANLVENAARYAGGVTRVIADKEESMLRIAVEDSGPGIPEEEREHIFERFSRGIAAGNRGSGEGSGLGLALVAEHVKLHGGKVFVEDAPGGGARFVVELPLAPGVIGHRVREDLGSDEGDEDEADDEDEGDEFFGDDVTDEPVTTP